MKSRLNDTKKNIEKFNMYIEFLNILKNTKRIFY